MATIMSWGNNEGTKGRCDGRCHSAKHPKCKCMCGGKFHGSAHQPGGVRQALEDYWDDVVSEAAKKAEEQGLILETERWGKNRQKALPMEVSNAR